MPADHHINPLLSLAEVLLNAEDTLTEEQNLVLDHLDARRRLAVRGCAGSGKTLLALEKAIRLDADNLNVLLLCHNPYLAHHLRGLVKGTQIAVSDFNTYVHFLVANHLAPNFSPRWISQQAFVPRAEKSEPTYKELVIALDQLRISEERFDALIVDEGQDFHADWWELAEASLQDPGEGIFYIFFDDDQALNPTYRLSSYYPVPLSAASLTRNCRNAGKIFDLLRPLHDEPPELHQVLVGRGIVQHFLFTPPESQLIQTDSLFEQLEKALLFSERFSDHLEDIVVMCESLHNSRLNGLVFDSPVIRGQGGRGHLRWKKPVVKHLSPFGLKEDDISGGLYPTKNDLNHIRRFCRDMLHRRRIKPSPKSLLSTIGWTVDRYGELVLSWNREQIPKLSEREIFSFFSQKDWMKGYPSNHKRYRLTLLGDRHKYPDFINVNLVDIPTFKGLEADGIVFVWEELVPRQRELLVSSLHVSLSRAKTLLAVVSPYDIREKIAGLRPEF